MPTYTRKHYIDMANTLVEIRASKAVIEQWCKEFKADNPCFDKPKFLAYIKSKKK